MEKVKKSIHSTSKFIFVLSQRNITTRWISDQMPSPRGGEERGEGARWQEVSPRTSEEHSSLFDFTADVNYGLILIHFPRQHPFWMLSRRIDERIECQFWIWAYPCIAIWLNPYGNPVNLSVASNLLQSLSRLHCEMRKILTRTYFSENVFMPL